MSSITDPMNAHTQLQVAFDKRVVQLTPCEIYRELGMIADKPNGTPRFTYTLIKDEKVQAVSLFALTEPIKDIPCFNIGYAVIEKERSKGIAAQIVKKGIDELQHGLKRKGISEFHIEAVISVTNEPSKKLAEKLISDSPISGTDSFSGEAVLQYVRKVK